MRVPPLLASLRDDDFGGVLATEFSLVGGILLVGIIPGLVSVRDAINSGFTTQAQTLERALTRPVVPPPPSTTDRRPQPELTKNSNSLTPSP